MALFCGQNATFLSVREEILTNECLADGLLLVPHVIFICAVIPALCYVKKSQPSPIQTWTHFSGHHIRWVLMLILMLFQLCQVGESVVSELKYSGFHLHLHLSHIFSITGSMLSLAYYNEIEIRNMPRFLPLLPIYWTLLLVVHFIKVAVLFNKDLGVIHLRFDLTWDVIVMYGFLLMLEVAVFCKQKYMCFRSPVILPPWQELLFTNYKQSFVNFLSKTTYWWMNSILVQGYKQPLEMHDLGKLPQSEKSCFNYKKLNDAFIKEKGTAKRKKKYPSLLKCYVRAFWPMVALGGFMKFLADLLGFVGPLCIRGIVSYVVMETSPTNQTGSLSTVPQYISLADFMSNGFVLVFVMFLASLSQSVLMQTHHHLMIREAIRCRGAVQTLVYDKALQLASYTISGGQMTVGKIVNHMSTDAQQIIMVFYFINHVWGLPLQLLLTLGFLYNLLGVSALIGCSIILILSPIQFKLASALSTVQKNTLGFSDSRLKLVNELLQGIKLLKLYAWEMLFCEKVEKARDLELHSLFKAACIKSLSLFIINTTPIVCTLTSFLCFAVLETEELTASKAFSALALFNTLTVPLFMLPTVVSSVVNCTVSTKRVLDYLMSSETQCERMNFVDDDSIELRQNVIPLEEVSDEWKKIKYGSDDGSTSVTPRLLVGHESPKMSSLKDSESPQSIAKIAKHVKYIDDVPDDTGSPCDDSTVMVELEKASFTWDPESTSPDLTDITLSIYSGQLTMVVGQVGSGKSSLVSGLLHEMCLLSGKMTWSEDCQLAYAAQKPWLLNATLKDNILFGQQYDRKRYHDVIEACALHADIDILPAGHLTEIGEKGINLSGGQKQRVSVARAMYSHTNVVILDDPLSALDVHVGKQMLEEGILRQLIGKKRTVILVSHQLQYLKYAHKIIYLKDGTATDLKTLMDVKESNIDLYNTFQQSIHREEEESQSEPDYTHEERESLMRQCSHHTTVLNRKVVRMNSCVSNCISEPGKLGSNMAITAEKWDFDENDPEEPLSVSKLNIVDEEFLDNKTTLESDDKEEAGGKLIKAEERNRGSVKLNVYMAYARACTVFLAIFVVVIHMVHQGMKVGTDFWLAAWSSSAPSSSDISNSSQKQGETVAYYMTGYGILSGATIIIGLVSGASTYYTGLRASRYLHSKMIQNVVLAPMRFFDTTPVGRILNRFSTDIMTVDILMPSTMDGLMFVLFQCLSAMIVNTVASPYFLIFAIPMVVVYYILQWFYRASARELQRLDNISKSPIFSHFSETLGGLSTIRAYKDQKRFREHVLKSIDTNNTAFLFLNTANRWLGIRLDFLGCLMVFISSLASLLAGLSQSASPGWVGLAIVYALNVALYLNWVVRNSTDAEMQMNAIERIQYYSNIPTELYEPQTDTSIPKDWPLTGSIEFKNVSLTYDMDLDPVIREVSLRVTTGEKIGICGRTGSGKSSLTLALFRLIDIAEGAVEIDGIDVKSLPLLLLRSHLSVIPQDPVLFAGTVRYNLDPMSSKSDSDLWQALDIAQLKPAILELPDQLAGLISEGGENFSVGQRQLFCLARAFLREAKIIVLDEATASIDTQTDNMIQEVISHQFKDCTVFTIAHRISTILTCDRVVVLDSGRIIEQGPPGDLVNQEGSQFASLVKADHSK